MKTLLIAKCLLLPVFLGCASKADTLTITSAGDGFNGWKDKDDYYQVDPAVPGRVRLGGFWHYSKPIYRFLIPPASFAPGVCDLSAFQIVVTGSGGGYVPVLIGGAEIGVLASNGQTTLNVPVQLVLSSIATTDSENYYIDLVIDVTAHNASYNLDTISVRLTYPGFGAAIANYVTCLGAANAIDNFNVQIAKNIQFAQVLSESFVTQAVQNIYSEIMPSWSDALPGPLPELWDVLKLQEALSPLTRFAAWESYFSTIATDVQAPVNFAGSASAALRSVAQGWRGYVQIAGNPSAGQVQTLNTQMTAAAAEVSGLTGALSDLEGASFWDRSSDQNGSEYGDFPSLIIAACSPMLLLQPNGVGDPNSFLPSLYRTLQSMQVSPPVSHQYVLSASAVPASGGSVTLDPAPNTAGTYNAGTVVTLTPHPATGWAFVGWSGDAAGSVIPLRLTVNSHTYIEAIFAAPQRGTALSLAQVSWQNVGNYDPVIEGNEQTHLTALIRNQGSVGAIGVQLSLASTVGAVQVFSGLNPAWDVAAGASQSYGFNLILNQAAYANAPFTLHASYQLSGLPYYQDFPISITFYATGSLQPVFAFDHLVLDDSADNANGVFESGDSPHFTLYLKNTGAGIADNVRVAVTNLSTGTVNGCAGDCSPAFYQYGPIPDDGTARAPSQLQFTPQVQDVPKTFVGQVTGDVVIQYGDQVQYLQLLHGVPLFNVQPATWMSVTSAQDFGVHGTDSDITNFCTIRNTGSQVLHVTAVSMSSTDTTLVGPALPWAIAVGGSVTVQVVIRTSGLSGQISRQTTFASDARPGGNVFTVTGLVSDGPPIFQVPTVNYQALDLDCNSNLVVWCDGQNIRSYDVTDGSGSLVYTAPNGWRVDAVRASGNLIVWESRPNGNYTATNVTIMARDLDSGTDYEVSPIQSAQRLVGVHDGIVAFSRRDFQFSGLVNGDFTAGIYNLYLYSTSATTSPLTQFSPSGNNAVQSAVGYDFTRGVLVFGETGWALTQYPNGPFWTATSSVALKFSPGVDPAPVQVPGGAVYAATASQFAYVVYGAQNTNTLWLWQSGAARQLASIWNLDTGALAAGLGQVVYSKDNSGLYNWDIAKAQEQLVCLMNGSAGTAPRMDGHLLAWRARDSAGWRLYFTALGQPVLTIAAADIQLSNGQPTELQPFDAAVTVHNVSRLDETGDVLVWLYDGNPASGGVRISEAQVPSASLAARSSTIVQFTNVVLKSSGSRSLYARIVPPVGENPLNNTARVQITVKSAQPNGPVVSKYSFAEYNGHTNGVIGSQAKVSVCWSATDVLGIGSSELLVDGAPAVVSGGSGGYCAVVGPLAPGVHQVTIITADADAAPLWSTNQFAFTVVDSEHIVVFGNGLSLTNGAVINLGQVPQNTAFRLPFLILNTGQQDLSLLSPTVSGIAALLTAPDTNNLPSQAATAITVSIDTSAPGAKTGSLVIQSSDGSDTPFVVNLAAVVRPVLAAVRVGPQLTLAWPDGFQLQYCTNLLNPVWINADGLKSPSTVAMSGPSLFYRLRPAEPTGPSCVSIGGLVGWWPGDGSAADLVGTNSGTIVSAGSFAVGEVGEGFSLNGVNQFVQVPQNSLWAFGANDFTIELWAKYAVDQPTTLICDTEGGGTHNKWDFTSANGTLYFHFALPAGSVPVSASFSPVPGTWYHLAVTRSGSAWAIYTNGVVAASGTDSDALPASIAAPLVIGASPTDDHYYMNGVLDEVSIYNRALTQAEIQSIFNSGSAGKCR